MADEEIKTNPANSVPAEKSSDELLREHINTLPKAVVDSILDFKWDEAVAKIGKKYGLHIDQMGVLRFESLAASSGLTSPADFFPTIKSKLNLSDEQAVNLTNDANEEIFSIIRKNIREKMGESKTEAGELKEAEISPEEKESIQAVGERFNDLPDGVQEAIIAPDLPEKIDLLAREYGVDPAKLDGLVSVVLLGIADPDNFDLELKNAFGLTDEKAKVLAAATEEAIWKNIKGKIKEVIAKEEMAKKVEGVFVKLDQEKYGTKTISALEETKAAEVARKTLLEEKLKGQFSLPASQSVVAPPIGTAPAGLPPIGKPAAPKIPVAPPTAPAPQIAPYREKPI